MSLVGNICDCDSPILSSGIYSCPVHGEKGKAAWDALEAAAKQPRAPRITIRHCDDWVAVYKDGQKVEENHSCSIFAGLKALGLHFEQVDVDGQMDDMGNMADGTDPFPARVHDGRSNESQSRDREG
jgi:hypothetical protein